MNKVFSYPRCCCCRYPFGRNRDAGGIRALRHSRELDCCPGEAWGHRLAYHFQQHGRGWFRPGPVAGGGHDRFPYRQLCGRERAIGKAGDCRHAESVADSTGNFGRTDSRRWSGYSCVLHAYRGGHAGRGGQGGADLRRTQVFAGDGAQGGLRAGKGLEGGSGGEPDLPADGAQFQSHDGHSGPRHHRRSGGVGGAW